MIFNLIFIIMKELLELKEYMIMLFNEATNNHKSSISSSYRTFEEGKAIAYKTVIDEISKTIRLLI